MTQEQKSNILPTIGRVVHYVSHGSADGKYPSVCRAAVVAEVPSEIAVEADGGQQSLVPNERHVNLCVLNPTGIFFGQVEYADPNDMKGGTWHWPCEMCEEPRFVPKNDPEHMVPIPDMKNGDQVSVRGLTYSLDVDKPVMHHAEFALLTHPITACGITVGGASFDADAEDWKPFSPVRGWAITIDPGRVDCPHCQAHLEARKASAAAVPGHLPSLGITATVKDDAVTVIPAAEVQRREAEAGEAVQAPSQKEVQEEHPLGTVAWVTRFGGQRLLGVRIAMRSGGRVPAWQVGTDVWQDSVVTRVEVISGPQDPGRRAAARLMDLTRWAVPGRYVGGVGGPDGTPVLRWDAVKAVLGQEGLL